MQVKFSDSMDKLGEYFERLEVDRYNVYLSPTFFRTLNCPSNCGACCLKFSLDYITEKVQKKLKVTYPEIYREHFRFRKYNDRFILSDLQEDNFDHHCQFLDENARCKIHSTNPLSCRVEPIKFKLVKNRVYISKSFYRNSWRMTQVNGEKGCLCSFNPYTEEQHKDDIQVLQELNDVAELFRIETVLPQIIDLLEKLGSNTKLKNKIPIQIVGMDRLDEWI